MYDAAHIRNLRTRAGSQSFFRGNHILNASETGALAHEDPGRGGAKLLLINEAAERMQECRVVRTSCCASQELEVAVEFSAPQPDFLMRLGEQSEPSGIEKRKSPRVTLPRGMNITGGAMENPFFSKVQTISLGAIDCDAEIAVQR